MPQQVYHVVHACLVFDIHLTTRHYTIRTCTLCHARTHAHTHTHTHTHTVGMILTGSSDATQSHNSVKLECSLYGTLYWITCPLHSCVVHGTCELKQGSERLLVTTFLHFMIVHAAVSADDICMAPLGDTSST